MIMGWLIDWWDGFVFGYIAFSLSSSLLLADPQDNEGVDWLVQVLTVNYYCVPPFPVTMQPN